MGCTFLQLYKLLCGCRMKKAFLLRIKRSLDWCQHGLFVYSRKAIWIIYAIWPILVFLIFLCLVTNLWWYAMVVSFVTRDAEDLNVPFCPCLQLECWGWWFHFHMGSGSRDFWCHGPTWESSQRHLCIWYWPFYKVEWNIPDFW